MNYGICKSFGTFNCKIGCYNDFELHVLANQYYIKLTKLLKTLLPASREFAEDKTRKKELKPIKFRQYNVIK